MHLSDFLIGRSSKRNDKDTIGQFGEGAPVGCLVLARSGRTVSVKALGKQYTFSLQFDAAWDASLLTIDIEDTQSQLGTVVTVGCTAEEMQKARNLFLALTPKKVLTKTENAGLLDEAGQIYVNGLHVTDMDSLFGYNFFDKKLVNRDRNVVGHYEITSAIGKALSDLANKDVIMRLLMGAKEHSRATEFSAYFEPQHKLAWKRAIKELWGDKVALASRIPSIDVAAIKKNWTVLDLPYNLASALRSIIPDAKTAAQEKVTVLVNDMTAADKEFLAECKAIADEIAIEANLNSYPVKVFRQKEEGGNFKRLGEARRKYCCVAYSTIKERNKAELVNTLIHEYTHHTTGFDDHTLEFDNAAFKVATIMGMKFIDIRNMARLQARWK